jgi:hypothetical protein
LLPACITSAADLFDILTGVDMDTSEDELSDESYCSWIIEGFGDDKGVNGDEGGNSDEGGSVCFLDLVFASLNAAESTVISVFRSATSTLTEGRWLEEVILIITFISVSVLRKADVIDITLEHEPFVELSNCSLIRLMVRDKPQPAYIH